MDTNFLNNAIVKSATAAAALLTLCSLVPSLAASQAVTVRDSAGISIVENSPLGAQVRPSIQIVDRARLQIGVESGDVNQQFVDISAVIRLSDGSIAVADRGPGEIRLFDSTGNSCGRSEERVKAPANFGR